MLAISREAKLAFDLRVTWQGRCVAAAKGTTAAVLMSVLCHNYEEAARWLYDLIFPGGIVVPAPYLESAGRVAKNGAIIAKLKERDGITRWRAIYSSEIALRDDFRRLADHLKLSDKDRTELFGAVKRWLVADRRLDPNMDPKDPDAKRLVAN